MDNKPRTLSYAQGINEALAQAMGNDDRIFLMGEDIGPSGGMFTVTKGLYDRFGPRRVVETPIAEAGFVGAGVGAAAAGMRPVLEIMFIDFAFVAMDQLLNEAAKIEFLTAGDLALPLVVRTQQGLSKSGGSGPQHSQSLEAVFAHVPGFAVAVPSTPHDAKGLMLESLALGRPVLFIEHRGLYFVKGNVPADEYRIPFGVAAVRREGEDVTIVTYSGMVETALSAAADLASQGISAEVVDLRTLVPMDEDTILQSAAKTGRVIVVHEAHRNVGVGAEISSRIHEQGWRHLRAPVFRIAGLDMPVPYAQPLESRWVPQSADIQAVCWKLLQI